MNRLQSLCLSALVLASLPLIAGAAGGAFEINQDCIAVGCFAGDDPGYPVTITQPGSYILTSDLAPAGNQFVYTMTVNAAPVDIDLNGHTIEGGASCTGTPVTSNPCTGFTGDTGIALTNGGTPGVFHVHNGHIHGFRTSGIYAGDVATGSLFEHLTLSENQFGMAMVGSAGVVGSTAKNTGHIRDVQMVRNSGTGITTSGAIRYRVLVEDSTAMGNGGYGLYLGAGSVVTGSRITDNALTGMDCSGFACALGQNAFQGNAGGGNQYVVGTVLDMGGNVCLDHTCP
jgi:hypothetical protein